MSAEEETKQGYFHSILHDRKTYIHKRELGRGSIGIVYLYEEEKGDGKIVVKAPRDGND